VAIPDNTFSWQLEDFENNISEVVNDTNTNDILSSHFQSKMIAISHVIREYVQYFKRISVCITGSQVTSD
jgi:hypothetical protein